MAKRKSINKTIIFSMGGSIVVPDEIDVKFLKTIKKFILSLLSRGYRLVIIIGGGELSKRYNQAARALSTVSNTDLDWMGIACTKVNAELVRVILSKYAYPQVVADQNKVKNIGQYKLILAGGLKPGQSTDGQAVGWAKKLGAKEIINLTNIDKAYTADPRKDKNARPLDRVSWAQYRKIVGSKWSPRMSTPFDPTASRLAQKYGMRVAVLNGRKLNNLKNYLAGKNFIGTVIE